MSFISTGILGCNSIGKSKFRYSKKQSVSTVTYHTSISPLFHLIQHFVGGFFCYIWSNTLLDLFINIIERVFSHFSLYGRMIFFDRQKKIKNLISLIEFLIFFADKKNHMSIYNLVLKIFKYCAMNARINFKILVNLLFIWIRSMLNYVFTIK